VVRAQLCGEAATIENCVHTIPRGFGDSCWSGLGVCILQYTRTWRTASGGGSGLATTAVGLQHFVRSVISFDPSVHSGVHMSKYTCSEAPYAAPLYFGTVTFDKHITFCFVF
jgi:hypothetical protein